MNLARALPISIAGSIAIAVAFSPTVCLADGDVGAVALQGDYAYVGINRDVVVVDISDPRRPTPVGQTILRPFTPISNVIPGWFACGVRAIGISGNHACVVYHTSGWSDEMVIFDVSTPADPKLISSYSVPAFRGGMLAIAAVLDVAVSGQYAYVYHTYGLDVVDISNPISPKRVGLWQAQSPIGDSPAPGRYVAVMGNLVYVAGRAGGLRVLDVSDPTDPKEIGLCPDVSGTSVDVVEKHAFVSLGGMGLRIIDLGDPANPKVIGSYDPQDRQRKDATMVVAAAGKYVFMFGGQSPYVRAGLQVLDVSDHSAPKEVFFSRPGQGLTNAPLSALTLRGDYAYMGVGSRLVVADVSDSKQPSQVGSTSVLPPELTDVAVTDDYAFVAGRRAGLRVLDISNARSPKEFGSFGTSGSIATVTVAGNYAFAGGAGVLHVLDVSDPKALREVTSWKTGGSAARVALLDEYVCVAADEKTLKVFDFSEPANPKEMGSYELQKPAVRFRLNTARSYPDGYEETPRIAVSGDHLFVFGIRRGGIDVYNLACLAWAPRLPYLLPVAVAASIVLALLMFSVRRSINPYLLIPALIVVVLPLALLLLAPSAPRMVNRYNPGAADGKMPSQSDSIEETMSKLDNVVAVGGLAMAERYAYMGEGGSSGSMLWVVDFSDPTSPRKVGSCELWERGGATDVAVAGKHAYIVNDFHGLKKVDISDPAAPKVIDSCESQILLPMGRVPSNPQAVAVAGQNVLVTDGQWGMRVFGVFKSRLSGPIGFYDSLPDP